MGELAIKAEGLGKQYRIGRGPAYQTLRDSLAGLSSLPRRWLRRATASRDADTIWALCDVSFGVAQGEIVGIIGRNGSGKSTLLKVLSRITEPTRGEVELRGRVGSLLEVGSGFNPELTGRENIYLNGAILGMRRAEIARKFDEIVAFAGVDVFLDTPVKHYSSGMYMRLAFAVAAHLEPEILLVDEVLAVGDAAFQKKCLSKMGDVAGEGRTVLLVSHNMQAVGQMCRRGICLDAGRVLFDGDVREAITTYYRLIEGGRTSPAEADRRPGSGDYRFTDVTPDKSEFAPDEEKGVRFTLRRRRHAVKGVFLSAYVTDAEGTTVAQCDSRLVGVSVDLAEEVSARVVLRAPWLRPGDYHVNVIACAPAFGVLDRYERACSIRVVPLYPYPCGAPADAVARAVVLSDFGWDVTPTARAAGPFSSDEALPHPERSSSAR
jgi:lipopolysaccharide transport system ATP-binding protein